VRNSGGTLLEADYGDARRRADRVTARSHRMTAESRPSLIDTRLVRAELARLRGPRPATQLLQARIVRSTISAAR
jgi:hypothetical protein